MTWVDIVWVVLRMILFFAAAGFVAWSILPRLMNWIHITPEFGQLYGVPVFALMFALFLGWSAETLGGVAAISGTFLAGFGLSRINARAKHEVEQASAYVSYAFLVPIFFVSIGLVTDFAQLALASLPYAGAPHRCERPHQGRRDGGGGSARRLQPARVPARWACA